MARPAGMIVSSPATGPALANDDPRYTAAEFPPNKLLYLAQLADQRGIDSRSWFGGLALSRNQIADPALRVSYRQASTFIRRALQSLDVPDAGLRIGREGTIGSFGLLGLAMMTSRSFGEAMQSGIRYHKICGCLLDLAFEVVDENAVALVATPQFGDTELLPFFCEELFASSTMISRELIGPELQPMRVELSYPQPDYADAYRELFRCELRFGMAQNRLLIDNHLLGREIGRASCRERV